MDRKILIYGDVNLNYRDGSGAWLVALSQCLLTTRSEVHILLKADILDEGKSDVLSELDGAIIHTPFDDKQSGFAGMKPRQAAQRIVALDRWHHFDMIVSRGYDIASHLAISGRFEGRMWPYLTEGPVFAFERNDHDLHLIDSIGRQSRRVFFQTEEARSIAESLNPVFTGKTLIMNPIVPDEAFIIDGGERISGQGLHIVYAGKFARHWNTLEIATIPSKAASAGVDIRLTMVGDKFQNTGNDHDWLEAMKEAAAKSDSRVNWVGGLPRKETIRVVASADLGMCWRDPVLDSSPEISTKMLECSAVGTPPVLNRTTMHEALLGRDYPLFVDGGNVQDVLHRAAASKVLVDRARKVARNAVKPFSMAATAKRFLKYFARAETDLRTKGILVQEGRKHRVLVAGHDFKFASDLIETLRQRKDVDLRIDKWQRLAVHDKSVSLELAHWADTIVCEWAGPNSVFYAKHCSTDTRLLVRFHGFEVNGKWLQDLDVNRVDAFIFVSDFYRKYVIETLGWPENRSTVIHNTIDVADLDRPKLSNARFHLGMAGYVPFLKRPDRAVSLLKEILGKDTRYYLHIRGKTPWSYQWEWNKLAGQDAYRAFFSTVADDPFLRQHVVFEPFAPDMGNWFRKIGWVVSPSVRETFHLAPVEGMASGAPALVWDREGAHEIFGSECIRSTSAELADIVLACSDFESWSRLSSAAKARAHTYDLMNARGLWLNLLQLPKGVAPGLNGTSIYSPGHAPESKAQAIAALHHEFNESGVRAAEALVDRFPEWLETERSLVASWRRLEEWADGTSIPRSGLAPLYTPDYSTVVCCPSYSGVSDAFRFVVAEPDSVTGLFDYDVLIAADSYVRAAIRERAGTIVVKGPLSIVLGGHIAARRLGITFFGEITLVPESSGRTRLLLDKICTHISSTFKQLKDTTPTELRGRHNAALMGTRLLESITVGLVADEFTRRTVGAAVNTVLIHRNEYERQLENIDVLIVESAWEGVDHEWFHGVAYHGEDEAKDLWSLIDSCRCRSIPVLFWNKEDPVHFRSFSNAASRCDHVFTTDAGRIPAYLEQAKQNVSVSSLPFYAEPTLHNPLPGEREFRKTVEFAGSYYGSRYPKRTEELRMILEVAAKFGLTIYDRQQDIPDSKYLLPETLAKFSVGSVPYSRILDVYKSHPVNINVNSVSDSPTMFSRRVVEIAASGSVVASGAGRGVTEVLGNSFPVLSTPKDWEDSLHVWMNDETARLQIAWAQMRTVLLRHRADQALVLMLRTAGIEIDARPAPRYGWRVQNADQVRAAAIQTLSPIVLTNDLELASLADELGLETAKAARDVEWITEASGSLHPSHFEDLLLATMFTQADAISSSEDLTLGEPLIRPGIGDRKTAVWRSCYKGVDDAKDPWVWRVSKVL